MKNLEQSNQNSHAEEGQTIFPAEMQEAEKEIHMTGRAVKIDETLEQYRKEREESWQKKLEQQKAKDQEELKEVRRSIGLEPETKEAEKDGEVVPIEIAKINENSGIERRKIDSKNISFQQDGEKVKIIYAGREWYSKDGQFYEKTVGDKTIKVIFANENSDLHASYEPLTDVYTIGQKAKAEFEKDPEMFLSSINHEMAHDEYFSLGGKQQEEINNMFLQDVGLQNHLRKFVATLYADKLKVGANTAGENYLRDHDVNNDVIKQNTLTPEGQKGLKDARSMAFDFNGQRKEVFVGLPITELISYMSSLEISQEVFDKVVENAKMVRGGEDPRYTVIKSCYDYIKSNSQIYDKLKEAKVLGRKQEVEQVFADLLQE